MNTIDIALYNGDIEQIESGQMVTQECIKGTWRTIGIVKKGMELMANRGVECGNAVSPGSYRNIIITF